MCRSMTQTVQCGEGLTDVKREGADIERVSVQEHDTDRAIHVSVLLWNISFMKYIFLYLCTI